MTRKEVKNLLSIFHAFADGQKIEYRKKGSDEWFDVGDICMFNIDRYAYRIKPSPTYRPFASAEECWEEMQKHQPVGWIKDKVSKVIYCIGSLDDKNIYIGANKVEHEYSYSLRNFIFADGSAFGVKEE